MRGQKAEIVEAISDFSVICPLFSEINGLSCYGD